MFYFSRAEQVALLAVVALLLSGGGMLVYYHGQHAARAHTDAPLLVEAPGPRGERSAPIKAGAARTGAPQGGETGAEGRTSSPSLAGQAPGSAAGGHREQARGGATPSPGERQSRISLNAATAEELDTLPGIGPILAQRIVQYRERLKAERGHGFESVDELLNVPGIGSKRFAAVRDLVTL